MNIKRLILCSAVSIVALSGCSAPSEMFVTFHQELAEDVMVKFTKDTTDEEMQIQEPDIVKKEGYKGEWESYTLKGKEASFTVNAVYTPIQYNVSFVAQGELIAKVPFTIEDIHGEHPQLDPSKVPAVPEKEWFLPKWEDYTLKLSDLTVNAVYDDLKTYTASFVSKGVKIASDVTFDRNDIDEEGKLKASKIPSEVYEYSVTGYDVLWDFSIKAAADVIFTPDIYLHKYYLKFVDLEGNQIGELVPYDIESTWTSVNKPEAPAKRGYTVSWPDTVLSNSDVIQVVSPVATANEYTITYQGTPGVSQKVTYDAPYTLELKPTMISKWTYEDEVVEESGIWKIDSDVELTLERATYEDFSSGNVPSYISKDKSQNISSLAISEGEGMDGGNALKATVLKSDYGIHFEQEYLDAVFSDPTIKAMNFVAKGSMATNNFRHRTGASNITYEANKNGWGIATSWKEFSFTREMYEAHNVGVTGDYVIYGGSYNPGDYILIDRIDYAHYSNYDAGYIGFNNNSIVRSGNNYQFTCDYQGAMAGTPKHFYLSDGSTDGSRITACDLSSEIKTDGTYSFHFTKTSGYISLFLSKPFMTEVENSASKQYSFDVYSTVAANSTTSIKNFIDGKNNVIGDGTYCHPAKQWVTYTFGLEQGSSATSYRFLIIQGGTAGDWYFDNFRVVR